jgi:hypothetical protein
VAGSAAQAGGAIAAAKVVQREQNSNVRRIGMPNSNRKRPDSRHAGF